MSQETKNSGDSIQLAEKEALPVNMVIINVLSQSSQFIGKNDLKEITTLTDYNDDCWMILIRTKINQEKTEYWHLSPPTSTLIKLLFGEVVYIFGISKATNTRNDKGVSQVNRLNALKSEHQFVTKLCVNHFK